MTLGGPLSGALGVGPAAEEKIQRFFAVADDVNLVGQLMLPQRNQRQLHVVRVVLDQQEFHFVVVHIAICFCSVLRRLSQTGDRKIECCALIHRRFGPDMPAMLADDAVHRGQPDAGALELLGPMEALEHAKQLVGVFHVEANAVVADEDGGVAVGLRQPTSMTATGRGRVYFTALERRLAKTCFIKPGSQSTAGSGWMCHSSLRPAVSCLRSASTSCHQPAQRRGLPPQFLPANARQVEQVIHQQAHLPGAVADVLQVMLGFQRQRGREVLV